MKSAASLSVFVLALVGCSDSPELSAVSGTVYYNDQPLTHGVVMFQPTHGSPARGEIDGSGHFTLTTVGVGNGVRPGPNKVRISCREPVDPTEVEPGLTSLLIPQRYADFTTSGLTVDVKIGTNEPVELRLVD